MQLLVLGPSFLYFDTAKQKNRTAFPDIFIPETNTLIEIKSCYTYDKQNMIDRVKAYKENGYNFKMIMDSIEYDELPEQTSEAIKNRFLNIKHL